MALSEGGMPLRKATKQTTPGVPTRTRGAARAWFASRRRGAAAARALVRIGLTAAFVWLLATPALAQISPWENAVNVLQIAFTGPIARGLSLVAIVVGGLMFAYGEGQSKRVVAGIVFGIGMAIGAVNFMAWLFP